MLCHLVNTILIIQQYISKLLEKTYITFEMAFFNARFEDIRLTLSIQGYQLNNQFIVREVGYWSPKISGVIQFNCKISASRLDTFSAKNIHIAENECHGIKVKKTVENAMASSDVSSVIKCLYQVTKIDGGVGDYIGIIREENIAPIIYKAGLGKHVVELDDLQILAKNNTTLPSFSDIKYIINSDSTKYKPCSLHDNLRTPEIPVCARIKAEIIANHLKQLNAQQQQQHQQQHQQQTPIQIQAQSQQDLYSLILQQNS